MEKELLAILEKIINTSSRPFVYAGSDRTFVKVPSGLIEEAKEVINKVQE
jgi:hypothetical protein